MAGTAMLAYGVVFVLLLGEIDLSISYVAGIGALTVAELQLPGSGHEINGLLAMLCAVAICAAIGGAQGAIVAFVGVPSFVVTLAGFMIWQGVILKVLEQPGSIIIQDRWINYTASYFFSDAGGLAHRGDHHRHLRDHRARRRDRQAADRGRDREPRARRRQAGRCRRRGLRNRRHLQPRDRAARACRSPASSSSSSSSS